MTDDVLKLPSTYTGPPGPLQHRCSAPQCSATGPQLLQCTACLAVRYCGREHQAAHRPQHKSVCNLVKKARAKVAKEEDRIRNAPADSETPATAFETHVGHFWSTFGTREYIYERFALAGKLLLPIGTLDAVREALDHLQDMVILCRDDNMGRREMIPLIMLRLDLDQECCDFVKWWETCGLEGHHHWGIVTLPEGDVLEDPGYLHDHNRPELHHVIAILLLKLKVLVDICNIQITRKIVASRRLPFDILAPIELAVIRSPLSAKFRKESPKSLSETKTKLLRQIQQLGAILTRTNEHFMANLIEPYEALRNRPEVSCSEGSWNEMALAMKNSYAAWSETEGVMEMLDDALACAAENVKGEVRAMIKDGAFESGPVSHLTPEEFLKDVSVHRVWEYLDQAMENASYLGPSFDRPSERRLRENKERLARAMAVPAGDEAELDEERSVHSGDED